MSTAESDWEFGVAVDPEDALGSRADRRQNPAERVTGHCYQAGVIELRSAKDGEYLNSTHGIPNLRDHR